MDLKKEFPVFIVGMPRSGTKLMRSLLGQHQLVSLTPYESHFIPFLVNNFALSENKKDEQLLKRIVKAYENTEFGLKMSKKGQVIDVSNMLDEVDTNSWSSILKYFLKISAGSKYNEEVIWGDKTPGYINHIPFLKEIFEDAKFIHVIRDPRDYCLSTSKGWGKSLKRAAQRWEQSIQRARDNGKKINKDYLEIFYEELVSDTERVMHAVSEFLDIPFSDALVKLQNPTPEDIGDVKDTVQIAKKNFNKYKAVLSDEEIKQIEELVFPAVQELPYQLEYGKKHVPLKKSTLQYYKIVDGIQLLRTRIKQKGFAEGIRFFFNHYTKSSWRF